MARADDPRRLPHDPPPDSRLRCPKDATLMERVRVGKFEVDRCNSCGALWMDQGEFDRIVTEKGHVRELDIGPQGDRPHDTRLASSLGGVHCPRDNQLLFDFRAQNQAHVQLLACKECGGVLLDAGELKDLSEFTLVERLKLLIRRS